MNGLRFTVKFIKNLQFHELHEQLKTFDVSSQYHSTILSVYREKAPFKIFQVILTFKMIDFFFFLRRGPIHGKL